MGPGPIFPKVALQDPDSLGLIMPVWCPHLRFSPMADFTSPFFCGRILGAATSFTCWVSTLSSRGGQADFDFRQLDDHYRNVRILNNALLERIRTMGRTDAHANSYCCSWELLPDHVVWNNRWAFPSGKVFWILRLHWKLPFHPISAAQGNKKCSHLHNIPRFLISLFLDLERKF